MTQWTKHARSDRGEFSRAGRCTSVALPGSFKLGRMSTDNRGVIAPAEPPG